MRWDSVRRFGICGLLVCGCSSSVNSRDLGPRFEEDSGIFLRDGGLIDSSDPFFVLLMLVRALPVARTPQELMHDAVVVGVGRLVSVSDGRIVDFKTGAPHPINTAVFQIEIDKPIKGQKGTVYAEFIRGGISVDEMMRLLPTKVPMMFMLENPANHWPVDTYKFINEGSGLPPGETLQYVAFPNGMIIETDHGLEYPLADDPTVEIFQSATLVDLQEELTKLAQ